MHGRIFFLLVGLNFISNCWAQQYIKGVVIDSITRDPIPFVSISINGTGAGTITNEKGRFLIRTNVANPILDVHEIRYKAKQVVPTVDDNFIQLQPSDYLLKETIIEANEAAQLFKKAVERLKGSDWMPLKTESFFRLITKTDDTCTEMIENFYSGWLGKTGVRSWQLNHGRYAVSRLRDTVLIPQSLDFSVIFRYLDLLNKPQTNKINYLPFIFDTRYYNTMWFTIGKRIGGNNHLVRIDFEPRTKYLHRINTSGSIYLNSLTGEIHKLIQRFDHWEASPLITSTSKDSRIQDLKVEFEISMLSQGNRGVYINHIRQRINYNLQNNKLSQNNRRVNTYADLLFYKFDVNNNEMIPSGDDAYSFDYDQIRHRLYIQRFWENNPILQETPYEENVRRDFEQHGSFGKMFNQSDDTLDMLYNGLLPWSINHPIRLDELSVSPIELKYIDNYTLKTDNAPIAILAGELFLAWNCYNDSFYKVIFPLLNTNASWVADDGTSSIQLEYLFRRYHDLLEVHRRILLQKLDALTEPCRNTNQINQIYADTKAACHKLTETMLGECWHHGQIDQAASFRWQKKIDALLKATN